MKSSVRRFCSPAELAATLAEDIVRRITHAAQKERNFSIALSGGSAPELLYSVLGDEYSDAVPWEFVQLFWGDERCVPPGSPDSNYAMAKKYLIDNIRMPEENIHRMRGEDDPEKEASRYSLELFTYLPSRDGLPVLDLQILGVGNDGHTASIFPGNIGLFSVTDACVVTTHPSTGQKRLTMTGSVINNSEAVVFIATGKSKADIIRQIFKPDMEAHKYPAANVMPVYGSLDWFIDEEAGILV